MASHPPQHLLLMRLIERAGWFLLISTIGIAVGVAFGLLYGLTIDPITYTDVEPQDMALPYQSDYLNLIAADYAQSGDATVAAQRLQRLGLTPQFVADRATVAIFQGNPLAGSLARLATDLGAGLPTFATVLATPSITPTVTPLPTATVTPSRTPSARATSLPTLAPVEDR